ncbi:T9SS type A sorting domain-containing protein [bacterium]|nr:T9SS type A sorting domain-containing protein [bacterium]
MKRMMMILTLLVALSSSAYATWRFANVTPPDMLGGDARAVAWGDVNGDGQQELFVGVYEGRSELWFHFGNRWVDRAREVGVGSLEGVRSARWLDYDHDGLLDLFCLTDEGAGAYLYRQTESTLFESVELGLNPGGAQDIRSATWFDLDLDGLEDLVLSNPGTGTDEAYALVQTDEGFIEVRGAEAPFDMSHVAQISPIDLNLDGQTDFLVSEQRSAGGEVKYWMNRGGRFVDMSPSTRLPDGVAQGSVTWADFDHDGDLDLASCQSSGSRSLFYQMPGGTFVDRTSEFGLESALQGANSVQSLDVNGDGWSDLFVTRPGTGTIGNVLLINDAGEGWLERQRDVGIVDAPWHNYGSAWTDFDGDGDLDYAVAQGAHGISLYRNDPDEAPNEHVVLKLCGSNSSTPVLNCLVSVNYPSGKQWAATSMYNTSTSSSDNTICLYNWKPGHSTAYSVDVVWPNGAVTTITEEDFALNHAYEMHMPMGISGEQVVLPNAAEVELVNYPNPFNPSTTVSFVLPSAGDVTISVYNLLGQQVAMLAHGAYEAGSHSVVFDATSLPSGLYLARLDAPGQSAVHRMLLTK